MRNFIIKIRPTRPVTLNMGMRMPSWYDIYSLDDRDSKEDETGMLNSFSSIKKIIDNELLTIPESRIVIGGFSQGAAMALLTGLLSENKFGGVVALSFDRLNELGYLKADFNSYSNMGHSSSDEEISDLSDFLIKILP